MSPSRRKRVLIVDDNLSNLKLLAFLLKGHGFEVDVAIHAEEAVQRLAGPLPDLILMDIQLPGMDGLTLTRRLKADPRTRDIHIVAVTAYAMKGDEATALEAGCDDYITKPIDTRSLPDRLDRLLADTAPSPTTEEAKPLAKPRPADPLESVQTDVQKPAHRPQILVVEDNAITRRMVRFALERADFEVLEASSGQAALAAFTTHEVALVLQDLGLGDMDGFELVKRLRASPRGRETPILVFSGLLSVQDAGRITLAGFDDLVVKPVEPSRLVQIIRTHLPDGQAPTDAFGHGLRLIVADDDPVQRRLVAFRMGREGFEVQLASDGEEALGLARASLPAAILSDVLMPRLDGFGLCLAASRDPALCEVPIILATNSYVEPVDRELALRLGARDLVLRTPDLKDVLAVLRSNLAVPASPSDETPERALAVDGPDLLLSELSQAQTEAQAETQIEPGPDGELIPVNQDHAQRIAAQLEKHVALNTRMSQRSALLSAEVLVIRGISEALASHEDIDTALSMAIAACFDAGQSVLGGLLLVGPHGSRVLTTHHTNTPGTRELESFLLAPDLMESLAGGGSLVLRAGEATPEAERLLASAKTNCGVLVPLTYKARRFGALLMLCRLEPAEIGERTTFVEAVAAQVSQALAVAESFAERARSERQAIEQSNLLASILDSVADGVLVVDADGAVTRVNGPGRPIADLLQGPERGLFMADRVTALSLESSPLGRAMRGESVDGAEVFAQMSGEGRWYAVSARPWRRDASGTRAPERCGAVGIFRDVTREKATQSHLMTSDRMASVGLLAAGVAHEINNPLASVLTNLEVARKETLPRARVGEAAALNELAEILSDAREAAERVRRIVSDLKIFSRHEEVHDVASDVHTVLESTLRMANNEIRHRATLVKELHPVDLVEGSESRLGQVFLNLIVNAAQAIPEGNASAHRLTVKTHQEGERVHVAVSDTGVGMGPDALRRLFLPFYTTKGPGAGTGLGLAISHSIIRSLGGEIKVESEVDRGTTFTVILKVAHVEKPIRPISTTSANKSSTVRGRILVIDDEPLIGLSIKRLLARSHDVIPMTSAAEALEVLRTERFDIILCDLMMPQMTGMDFHAALEQEAPELASQVVFLTGGAFTPAARAFLDRVPNTRLNKPFASSELKGLIDERVAARAAESPAPEP